MRPGLHLRRQVGLLSGAQADVYVHALTHPIAFTFAAGANSSTHTTFQPWQAPALLVPPTLQHPQHSCQAWQALMALLLG